MQVYQCFLKVQQTAIFCFSIMKQIFDICFT